MKKLFLTVLGLALVAAPTLRAQSFDGLAISVEKVDVAKLKSAIAKSDAEISDPKKAAKAATWITRGETFLNADAKPLNGLFVGMSEKTLKTSFGDAAMEEEIIGNEKFLTYAYEHFKVYLKDGQVGMYVATTILDPAALDKAYDAFAKAYDLDKKTQSKVNTGLVNVQGKSASDGGMYYGLGEFKIAADNFRRAYKASSHPAVNMIDTVSLFYAGFLGTVAEDYRTALEDLNKAIELGFEAEGEAYYYKFHCLYSLGDREGALETLKHAVGHYPDNNNIIEGLLTLYSIGDEDPTDLIPMVQNAIDQNPTNGGLYLGLARVYDKLGQEDNAIEAADKAASLSPQDFFPNYFHGYFIVKKADALDAELRNMTITSRSQYQQALDEVNAIYATAVDPLETAFAADSSEIATVELLKNLTFRLRDTGDAMNAKYEKYDALYKSMGGGQ